MSSPYYDTIGSTTASTASVTGGVDQGNVGYVNYSGDSDWYRVSLRAGQTYTFDALQVGSSDPTLTLRNSAGTSLAFNDDFSGRSSRISYTASSSGTYFLDVRGYASTTGAYRLLSYTPGDQASTTGTAAAVSPVVTQSGVIATNGDHDYFRTTLNAGTTYIFSQTGTDSSPVDTYLRLRNGSGTEIAHDDDSGPGLNSQLVYTPTTSGTYFLDAGAYNNASNGRYSLTVAEIDTISGNTGTAANLNITGTPSGYALSSGRINSAADQDYFRVYLRAGEQYELQAYGSSSGGAANQLNDPTLTLRNSAGAQVAYDDDSGSGLNSLLRFRAATSGTYYVDVGGYGSNIGNFWVYAREVPGSTATYSTVAVNGTTRGDVGLTGDVDYHAVNLVAGRTYRFDARGSASGGGTLADPVLQLRNGGNTLLAQDDDSGTGLDSRLTYRATTSGTFYAATRGYGNNTGSYTLGVTQIA